MEFATLDLDGFYKTLLRLYMTFPLFGPVLLLISAPHGKFAKQDGRWNVNGKWGWMVMELVSPITFVFALSTAVRRTGTGMTFASFVPSLFYVAHYINRSIVSVIMSPSNGFSPMNIAVPLSAIFFNFVNGWLNGWWLGSAGGPKVDQASLSYWSGLVVMVIGFIGNVYHDEILRNIKRDKLKTGKGSSDKGPESRYAVPHGGLFQYISQPSYLCEWVEWFGFALTLKTSAPAWSFLAAEVGVMLPRALKTHRWYLETFGERYPKERKAIIPFVL